MNASALECVCPPQTSMSGRDLAALLIIAAVGGVLITAAVALRRWLLGRRETSPAPMNLVHGENSGADLREEG